MIDRHWIPGIIAVMLLGALACGPSEDGETGDGETGDRETGDRETGNRETETGDGEGETGDGDAEFDALCELGCAYFIDCAPAEFGLLYDSPIECQTACVVLYSACIPEATAYFECFTELTCADVTIAVTDGPAATACGPNYAAAQAACGL